MNFFIQVYSKAFIEKVLFSFNALQCHFCKHTCVYVILVLPFGVLNSPFASITLS